jgi:hypothetical protein
VSSCTPGSATHPQQAVLGFPDVEGHQVPVLQGLEAWDSMSRERHLCTGPKAGCLGGHLLWCLLSLFLLWCLSSSLLHADKDDSALLAFSLLSYHSTSGLPLASLSNGVQMNERCVVCSHSSSYIHLNTVSRVPYESSEVANNIVTKEEPKCRPSFCLFRRVTL